MQTNWKMFLLIVGGFVTIVIVGGIALYWQPNHPSRSPSEAAMETSNDTTDSNPEVVTAIEAGDTMDKVYIEGKTDSGSTEFNLADYQNAVAVIETPKGTIKFQLYPDQAPKTVENFVRLAESGYYDGLTFHRSDEHVIQGGDPNGDGTGGESIWGGTFEDEPVQGEYFKGAVAMANSGPDTNGSQFFICKVDWLDLPKSYNLFGQVIEEIPAQAQVDTSTPTPNDTVTQPGDTIETTTIPLEIN